MQEKSYTYILFNRPNGTLYVGVTNNLKRRIQEHKSLIKGFTAKYKVDKLGYFEEHTSIVLAIEREKKIKAGSRQKKLDMISSMNPEWKDLFYELMD
ncbi:MAG: GIY-YIG nuclease family protein [Fibrobacter sp.]|nr:GIY-YIG nuclease family protein [Fibrobacter sp.]